MPVKSLHGVCGLVAGRAAQLTAAAVAMVGVVAWQAHSSPAQAQASFNNFQQIGCYHNRADNRLWLAAIVVNPQYMAGTFDYENDLAVNIEANDSKYPFTSADVIVNPMSKFNFKGAQKYKFMKYSLVLDFSASIGPQIQTDIIKTLDKFVDGLPLAIEGQIIRFSDQVQAFPPTASKTDLVTQIRQPFAPGRTAFHDAMMVAATSLAKNSGDTPVKMIVAFTDGVDNASVNYKDRAGFIQSFNSIVKSSRIAVAVVGVTNQIDSQLLKDITSGGFAGFYRPIPDFTLFDKAFDQIKQMITKTIIFRLPKVGPDHGKMTIYLGTRSKGGSFTTIQPIDCEY